MMLDPAERLVKHRLLQAWAKAHGLGVHGFKVRQPPKSNQE